MIRHRSSDRHAFRSVIAATLSSLMVVAGPGVVASAASPQRGAEATFDRAATARSDAPGVTAAARHTRARRGVSPSGAGPWSALGSNGVGDGAIQTSVSAIATIGTDLYVAGGFSDAAFLPKADHIARWDGSAWSALGSDGGGGGALNAAVSALMVSGGDLYVGGAFTNAAGIAAADRIARWNGSAWSAIGPSAITSGRVFAIAMFQGDLYVGGDFTDVGGNPNADYLARWDGDVWSAVGSGTAISDDVFALTVAGGDLYIGGQFDDAGGLPEADNVARWSGTAWSALGSDGAGGGAIGSGVVHALAASGSTVYVGGFLFNVAGIAAADYVARWDGSWSALGSNGSGNGAILNLPVLALAVSGDDVYVGGAFTEVAGIPAADRIARWNGTTWSALGTPSALVTDSVVALKVTADALFVGGDFDDAAGIATADSIARWARTSSAARQPDGRIRLGTAAFGGQDVYNLTGAGQSRVGAAARGRTVSFGISIQNDGSSSGAFRVKATGAAASGYKVRYTKGTTDITSAVVAGTWQTNSLAPGAATLITAKVTVMTGAAAGSKVTRLVTLTSVGGTVKKDALKFTGKRS